VFRIAQRRVCNAEIARQSFALGFGQSHILRIFALVGGELGVQLGDCEE
jgi:hypothetical protein